MVQLGSADESVIKTEVGEGVPTSPSLMYAAGRVTVPLIIGCYSGFIGFESERNEACLSPN